MSDGAVDAKKRVWEGYPVYEGRGWCLHLPRPPMVSVEHFLSWTVEPIAKGRRVRVTVELIDE